MKIYVDGWLEKTNPSNKGGWTVKSNKILEHTSFTSDSNMLTNNQMELMAIIGGLIRAKKKDIIISDSQFSVNKITGKWKKNSKCNILGGLILLGRSLLNEKKCKIIWEKRDTNLAGIYNDEMHEQASEFKKVELF